MTRLILALAAILCIAAAPATTQTAPRATTATRLITVKDCPFDFPDDEAFMALDQHARQFTEQLVGPAFPKLGKWFGLGRISFPPAP